jgi:hypothetical protein
VRLARAVTRFPFAAEFQSLAPMGQEEVFGVLSDEHQRYITELALALGLRGIAYYVFVERDDAQGAPISPLGKVRPRLEQVKRAIEMATGGGPPPQLHTVGLLWSYDHHRMSISQRFPGWDKLYHCWIGMNSPQELPGWWDAFRALHERDVDFAITPMEDAEPSGVLLYAGPDEVRLDEWARVAEAVEGGATLATGALPTRDIDGRDDELAGLNERIRSSRRLVERPGAATADLLVAAGAEPVVSAATPGVWTSVYEGADAHWIFVANTGTEPTTARLAMSGELRARLGSARATDVVEGGEVTLGQDEIALPAKRVRAFVVAKDGA